MPHVNFLYEKAKRNHLIDEISRNLLLELKGLVAQQYTIINRKSGPCMIISSRCRKRNKLLELANKNQLLSNFCNKNSKYFWQGGAFPRKLTEESNKNIDFAIDTPPQCLTIQINSTNCAEEDYLLKTNLDGQSKEIRKCHHQKYLNTKTIINNINKSSCLEQKCELIIEKNNDNIETYIESKIDSEVAENKKKNLLEKQLHVRNLHQRNQQTFTKFK